MAKLPGSMLHATLEPAYPRRDEIAQELRELLDGICHDEEERSLRSIDAHLDRAMHDLTGRDRTSHP
jgi:hypothetical protein